MKTIRLRVQLREVIPVVTRVLDVPAVSTLPELHNLLQAGIGWTDSHLHQFVAGEVRYGVPSDDSWDPTELDESAAKLSDLPATFTYLYDFGDGWEHDVTVIGAGAEQPGCREGTGACPPEDCGGPPGYEELLAVLADPTHDEHDHMRSWAGDLKPFDLARTDLLVRNTAGEVPTSVRLVLDLARDGVKLTPGGRLPRSFVRAVQERRPHWYPLGRPASVEEDLLPLAELHDLLRKVGLLRLSKGVVRPTKIADNDVEILRRLRSWFTEREFVSILAGDVLAALLAFGPQSTQQLAARIYPTLDRWAVNGQPITERDVQSEIWSLRPILEGLDQIETDWRTWTAGPSAGSLLVRATALAA